MSMPVVFRPPFLPEFHCTLERGAEKAAQSDHPMRLWHDEDDAFAEVFFLRDVVLHAHVNGLVGTSAIAAMLASGLKFAVERGVWAPRCTIRAPWRRVLMEASRALRRAEAPMRWDEEETVRLSER